MAYSIIEKLKANGSWGILEKLSIDIEKSRAARNKQHNVRELSFDWKECRSPEFMKQKLDYIHFNPCSKKWALCSYPGEFAHSSAMFYECGLEGKTKIYNYMEMEDQDLTSIE